MKIRVQIYADDGELISDATQAVSESFEGQTLERIKPTDLSASVTQRIQAGNFYRQLSEAIMAALMAFITKHEAPPCPPTPTV